MIGREQRFHPGYSRPERAYISLFGIPVVGLRIRARNILSLLPSGQKVREVLDAGSGTGVITFLLAGAYPDALVTGVDMAEEEILASQRIAERAGLENTRFQTADISKLPWEGRFDLLVCVDILEHIEDDQAALDRLARALADGGSLLLHVPALYRRYPLLRKSLNFDVPTHVRAGYTVETIAGMVEKAGLSIHSLGYTYGFLETAANNLSYMITGARKRNKALYALAFPFLNLLGWLGRGARPTELGAGIFILAGKPHGQAKNSTPPHGKE